MTTDKELKQQLTEELKYRQLLLEVDEYNAAIRLADNEIKEWKKFKKKAKRKIKKLNKD